MVYWGGKVFYTKHAMPNNQFGKVNKSWLKPKHRHISGLGNVYSKVKKQLSKQAIVELQLRITTALFKIPC